MVEAVQGRVVGTVGAGDSFQAALLFALHTLGRIEAASLATIGAAELQRALSFAARCAAFTCGRPGADPPRRSEIDAGLSELLSGRRAAPWGAPAHGARAKRSLRSADIFHLVEIGAVAGCLHLGARNEPQRR